jgi:hypothetical protein
MAVSGESETDRGQVGQGVAIVAALAGMSLFFFHQATRADKPKHMWDWAFYDSDRRRQPETWVYWLSNHRAVGVPLVVLLVLAIFLGLGSLWLWLSS